MGKGVKELINSPATRGTKAIGKGCLSLAGRVVRDSVRRGGELLKNGLGPAVVPAFMEFAKNPENGIVIALWQIMRTAIAVGLLTTGWKEFVPGQLGFNEIITTIGTIGVINSLVDWGGLGLQMVGLQDKKNSGER